jgi:hypothetical protein
MSKSINIESNSMIGEYRKKVLLEIERLDKNLINLSRLYGIEASCLSAWKQTFLDTLWSIFSAMVPVKLRDLREKECVLIQPCVLLSDQRCSFLPGESFIHPAGASAISVNTVSPLYRRSTASFLKKRCGKYVPLLRLSGEWLLDYGFEIGKKYETYAKKNQLILKIGGCIGNGNGNGRGINSDNDNMDKNRNVPDGIGGANG